MKTEIIFLNNLQCKNCANTIYRLLMAIKGVDSVKVDIEQSSIIIVYNGNADLPAKFRQVLAEAGWPELEK